MKFWLTVERAENWEVDKTEGFCRFGLSDRKRILASQIEPGDLIFTYISSGKSSLADMRRVRSPALVRLKHGGNYDSPYPLAISTEPLIWLPQEKWVRIKTLAAELSFIDIRRDWRQQMRSSLRLLLQSDATILETALRSAAAMRP